NLNVLSPVALYGIRGLAPGKRAYRTNGFRTRPAIPNFTDHADICACDAKSKDYEISCKNGATDLIVIICGATCCKQEG
ncbi:MAG: hypothetical protein WA641_24670, partial [Candidatus Acidiferrales bacterium]